MTRDPLHSSSLISLGARLDDTAFFCQGRIVASGATRQIFTNHDAGHITH